MSRTHDGQRVFFPLGNPFRRIIPKGTSLSSKLLHLQNTFEESLTERLENLNKTVHSDILSLSWMKCALASLCETHRAIQSLITDLQFPVTEWDEQWVDMYLDNSVKILDICNGFSSELAHLDQSRILLQYIRHMLGQVSGLCRPSQEQQLKKAHTSLSEWLTARTGPTSPKLNHNMPSILRGLSESLRPTNKVKNSAKGKVLMQVMHGVKVHTIFTCGVLWAILSGSAELPMELPVSSTFAWAAAFDKLQTDVTTKLRRSLPTPKRAMPLKELELVDQCVCRLASLTDCTMEGLFQGTCSGNGDPPASSLDELASELGRNAEGLAGSLDALSKEVSDFFGVVLAGRDELLCNLRMPSEKKGCS